MYCFADLWYYYSIKSTIFCDVTQCSPVEIHRPFRGSYFLQQEASSKQWFCLLIMWLILWPWKWKQYVLLKCWWTFTRLHGIISQKIILFIITTVRTSNATHYSIHWYLYNNILTAHRRWSVSPHVMSCLLTLHCRDHNCPHNDHD
jgi:hypothetical protein